MGGGGKKEVHNQTTGFRPGKGREESTVCMSVLMKGHGERGKKTKLMLEHQMERKSVIPVKSSRGKERGEWGGKSITTVTPFEGRIPREDDFVLKKDKKHRKGESTYLE